MIAHPHIRLDEQGVAWIDDANIKVIEVVLDRLAYGWSPEEIHVQHPHLSLAQIHAALAHYWDHQATLDAEIPAQRRARRLHGGAELRLQGRLIGSTVVRDRARRPEPLIKGPPSTLCKVRRFRPAEIGEFLDATRQRRAPTRNPILPCVPRALTDRLTLRPRHETTGSIERVRGRQPYRDAPGLGDNVYVLLPRYIRRNEHRRLVGAQQLWTVRQTPKLVQDERSRRRDVAAEINHGECVWGVPATSALS